jgi:hypothetical protein
VEISGSDVLHLTFTAKDGGKAARPHQSFVLVENSADKLDIAIPIGVKSSGKAKLDFVTAIINQSDSRIIETFHLNC